MSIIKSGTTSTTAYQVEGNTNGDLVFQTNGTTTAMTINTSQNVGIGTSSPTDTDGFGRVVDVQGSTGAQVVCRDSDNTTKFARLAFDGGTTNAAYVGAEGSGTSVLFRAGAATRATLDSSGNLGLGVTPSAWDTAEFRPVEMGTIGNFVAGYVGSSVAYIGSNAYYNGGWKYARSSVEAAHIDIGGGAFRFKTAGTGTAGNAITWTQAMTLDASGNLGIGTSSPSVRLHVASSTSDPVLIKNTGSGAYNSLILESDNGKKAVIGVGGSTVGGSLQDAIYVGAITNSPLLFNTNNTERGRFTAGGLLLVNTTTSASFGNAHRIFRDVAEGSTILAVDGGAEFSALFYDVAGANYNAGATAIIVGRNTSTLRSINAGGTINASGADYAEYMTKAGDFVIAKGDVCGIDANGKLTNVFADAVSFVVKSTDPSYVGGDSWGAGFKDDPEGLEAARQKVDRIAFAGQVPVNVPGATPGQYIVPVDDNGAIKGVAVSNPTFEQYQSAVGKVISVQDDGRALIIVKVA